jgi:hypothetical protein
MPDINLLKITEAGRVVAIAKLEILDKDATLRNFYEALPGIVNGMVPSVINTMQVACSDIALASEVNCIGIEGNHSGIEIAGQMPQNGAGPNRATRRGH